jgi:hypothetical protein
VFVLEATTENSLTSLDGDVNPLHYTLEKIGDFGAVDG